MYKIDSEKQKAKIKNLEQKLDFLKYNIKEKKKKEKRKEKENKQNNNNKKTKPQDLLKNTNNNHPKTIYDVCLKKKVFF